MEKVLSTNSCYTVNIFFFKIKTCSPIITNEIQGNLSIVDTCMTVTVLYRQVSFNQGFNGQDLFNNGIDQTT